jgi:serine/threonine protein kinase HipA of HipAB toxin-antitoxin module
MIRHMGRVAMMPTAFSRRSDATASGRCRKRIPVYGLLPGTVSATAPQIEPDRGPGIHRGLEFLQASDEPEADRPLLLKAQVVFWFLAATDGHAKNFSIFLRPDGRFGMTPLYDLMSAQPNVDAGEIQCNRMKLAMAVGITGTTSSIRSCRSISSRRRQEAALQTRSSRDFR